LIGLTRDLEKLRLIAISLLYISARDGRYWRIMVCKWSECTSFSA
jgi:hypothetical protein